MGAKMTKPSPYWWADSQTRRQVALAAFNVPRASCPRSGMAVGHGTPPDAARRVVLRRFGPL